MAEKEHDKYLVLKWENLFKLCDSTVEAKSYLYNLMYLYDKHFESNKYIVINQDEIYAEEVWDLVLDHEEAKNDT